jgi:hypothetical protein
VTSLKDEQFLGDLNEAMRDRPLDLTNPADEKLYVPLYDAVAPEQDPVRLLGNAIRRSRTTASAHLFSGYRGSGKSTELRRLQQIMEAYGYVVVLVDMDGYLDPHTAVGVGDYLLDLAGAFDDAVEHRLPEAVQRPRFWESLGDRFGRWKADEVTAEFGIDLKVAKVGLKAALKDNPEFRQRLSDHLAHRLEVVVREVHEFIRDTAAAIGADRTVLLLVDSTEKLTDTRETGDDVKGSVRTLFAQHATRLCLPGVHTVYSVPPDLPIREPRAVATAYDGAVWSLAAVTVEPPPGEDDEQHRVRADAGVNAMLSVLRRRHEGIDRLVSDDQALRELVVASGGNLRNLLYLVRQVIARSFDVPASPAAVAGAITQLASDFRFLTDEEKRWLVPVVKTGLPDLRDDRDRIRFADFLDRQVVLPHRNGSEWFSLAKPVREMLDG